MNIDGYDCGVRYADAYVGRILNVLADAGVLEETAVIVSADHGENLGELNVWGDHQTADEFTNHIPGVVCWPGVTAAGGEVLGLHYHMDLASAIVDLAAPDGRRLLDEAGGEGISMADRLGGAAGGRERLYLSQGAWSLQRSVRWDDWLLVHTIDTGMKDFSEWMLFDLANDPHETVNLASEHPDLVRQEGDAMTAWFAEKAVLCPLGDPFEIVRSEGGPYHARLNGPEREPYLRRLEQTDRAHHAAWLRENGNAPRPEGLAAY